MRVAVCQNANCDPLLPSPGGAGPCPPTTDLVFIFDSSGSVRDADFPKVRQPRWGQHCSEGGVSSEGIPSFQGLKPLRVRTHHHRRWSGGLPCAATALCSELLAAHF